LAIQPPDIESFELFICTFMEAFLNTYYSVYAGSTVHFNNPINVRNVDLCWFHVLFCSVTVFDMVLVFYYIRLAFTANLTLKQ
jgi:hypothetical protein